MPGVILYGHPLTSQLLLCYRRSEEKNKFLLTLSVLSSFQTLVWPTSKSTPYKWLMSTRLR